MLNEEGWKINTAEYLRGRRGFCIFEINSKILSLVAKKYSSKLDIISLIYSYLCEVKK